MYNVPVDSPFIDKLIYDPLKPEGWGSPAGSDKFHFFKEKLSLCGRFTDFTPGEHKDGWNRQDPRTCLECDSRRMGRGKHNLRVSKMRAERRIKIAEREEIKAAWAFFLHWLRNVDISVENEEGN